MVDGGQEHGGYQVLIKGVGDPVWHIYMTSMAELFTDFATTVYAETGITLIRK